VRDAATSVVHHRNYLGDADSQALCGVAVENAESEASVPTASVCADCMAKLPEYHLTWWRETAEAATSELAELRVKYRELAEQVDNQRVEKTESGPTIDVAPQAETSDEPTTTPLLDQVRKELVELCSPFDGAVPYWRVKNSVDAYNDKLTSDDRVLLAHEIGAEGSLIRWCTKEIETLGWQITNSPVHGEAEDMMEAWTHDLYRQPKKSKWRLGRSRDGS
jgi:hypothetical protein